MRYILILFFILLSCQSAYAVLADCEQATVEAALSAATSGDTVECPATVGTVTWTDGVTIPEGVTLKGAGINNTVINSDTYISSFLSSNSKLKDFRFSNGFAKVTGDVVNFVVEDCYFGNISGSKQDHLIAGLNVHPSGVYHGCTIQGVFLTIRGDTSTGGSLVWSQNDNFTATNSDRYNSTIYFEGCSFLGLGLTATSDCMADVSFGGSYVIRFSTFIDAYPRQHAWRTTWRGPRKTEFYQNTLTFTFLHYYAALFYGGPLFSWSNNCIADSGESCEYLFGYETGMDPACEPSSAYDTTPHPVSGVNVLCRDAIGAGKDASFANGLKPGLPRRIPRPIYGLTNLTLGRVILMYWKLLPRIYRSLRIFL